MQDLNAILGPVDAAKFLDLESRNYLIPSWSFVVLYEPWIDSTSYVPGDIVSYGTSSYFCTNAAAGANQSPTNTSYWSLNSASIIEFDLTSYLASVDISYDDNGGSQDGIKSAKASFVVANPNGQFDSYSGNYTNLLIENRIIRYQKGFIDPSDSSSLLIPAYWGRITLVDSVYDISNPTITLSCGDALKNSVKQKFTSSTYSNYEVNLIATDLLTRYGKFDSSVIELTPVNHTYAVAPFPDMTLLDDLKLLFDPLVFWVRADEAGNITTGPRLGSQLSSFAGLLGYPDQLTPPPAADVAYTIPTGLIESISPSRQDFDSVINQVKVLGETTVTTQSLGPFAKLYGQTQDSSIGRLDKVIQNYPFSQSPAGSASLVASNVIVVFNFATDQNSIDSSPQTVLLSYLNWNGAWSSSAIYNINDAVQWTDGQAWACQRDTTDSAHTPGGSTNTYWTKLVDPTGQLPDLNGPYYGADGYQIINSDNQVSGFVALTLVTQSYVVLDIEGRTISINRGIGGIVHHGGFFYNFYICGSPVIVANQALVAFADYNTTNVVDETLTNPFGDNRTFQAVNAPFAMSKPVSVSLTTISGTTDLGTITADQTDLSGEENFSVDYDRGRIVLTSAAWQNWLQDDDSYHPLSFGGNSYSTTQVFNLSGLQYPAPQAVYQTFRQDQCAYIFPGLEVGQGYDIRLHFADPLPQGVGKRKFSVYANAAKVISGLDIIASAGGIQKNAQNMFAYQQTITGVQPDAGTGAITLIFTQHDPFAVGHPLLPECSNNGKSTGHPLETPVVCGIEIINAQGQGPNAYSVNCGGAPLTPSPVTVTASYGYSPVQQIYGIQHLEINDPLISTQAEAQNIADYNVNYSQWKRNRHTISTSTVPQLQPGDLISYTNPVNNCQFWSYLQTVHRTVAVGASDKDEYVAYLIYVNPVSKTITLPLTSPFMPVMYIPAGEGLEVTASGYGYWDLQGVPPHHTAYPEGTYFDSSTTHPWVPVDVIQFQFSGSPPVYQDPSLNWQAINGTDVTPLSLVMCVLPIGTLPGLRRTDALGPGRSATYSPSALNGGLGGMLWIGFNDIQPLGYTDNNLYFTVSLTRIP